MRTLICGSIAYDNIMVFPDHFKNHILPEKIHMLNVAFLVPEMRREFGGCAGNIAYNLKMLGGEPVMMATVGDDFSPYSTRFEQLSITQEYVQHVPDTFTAQAFITTDLADNQITAFHPGAMNFSHLNSVENAHDISLGIIAPDGRDGMLQHAREFHEAGIPFIFDPGQGLPMYNGTELLDFIDMADYIAVNDYEGQMLQDRTGCHLESLASKAKALIITLGAQGSVIYANGEKFEIPCVTPTEIIDPTGCGDAYRAGLLYGIVNHMDWNMAGQLASLMGSLKIARRGGQNHQFSRDEIDQYYFENFGHRIF
ncbi:carbohydrate kinase family protein [Nitrosomonas sp. JL21]|uniref:carbohydrate kinase family protein n=1 Tax=Nitrosomonas sp. JL21 TaxID=153949 RepID=UPI00136E73A8|nr:carbohydrate kinase family protein [Nitrosomonas sp. JL21]MBL8497110.1 carbohydrate kinase family protein [Nitrosomonas sp.]MCC7091358.1 carbohydrate kinase family protein [Nitrosomonas sp.]MXS78864.1 carbohydrate kinase family protein [Nitrosomonas sp. JL21]